jgi:hypothetical protein
MGNSMNGGTSRKSVPVLKHHTVKMYMGSEENFQRVLDLWY